MPWLDWVIAYTYALDNVRQSPGGEKLSYEACRICVVLLISMPDPNVQTPTDYEIEKFLAEYDNPRKLQKNWLQNYLGRPRPQLAIDVIRAFDEHFKQKRITDLKLWILGGLVVAQWAVILELGKVILDKLVK